MKMKSILVRISEYSIRTSKSDYCQDVVNGSLTVMDALNLAFELMSMTIELQRGRDWLVK